MELEYTILPLKDMLNTETIRQIANDGWLVNPPDMVLLVRPKPQVPTVNPPILHTVEEATQEEYSGYDAPDEVGEPLETYPQE